MSNANDVQDLTWHTSRCGCARVALVFDLLSVLLFCAFARGKRGTSFAPPRLRYCSRKKELGFFGRGDLASRKHTKECQKRRRVSLGGKLGLEKTTKNMKKGAELLRERELGLKKTPKKMSNYVLIARQIACGVGLLFISFVRRRFCFSLCVLRRRSGFGGRIATIQAGVQHPDGNLACGTPSVGQCCIILAYRLLGQITKGEVFFALPDQTRERRSLWSLEGLATGWCLSDGWLPCGFPGSQSSRTQAS